MALMSILLTWQRMNLGSEKSTCLSKVTEVVAELRLGPSIPQHFQRQGNEPWESPQQEFCNQATRGQGNKLPSHLNKGNLVGAVF